MHFPAMLLILSLFSGPAMAQAKRSPASEKSEVYANVSPDNTLEKMLEVPGVEPIYRNCQSTYSTPDDLHKIPDCIWNAVKADDNLKKKVMQVYNDSLKRDAKKDPLTGRAPASKNSEALTDRKLNIATDYSSDPTVQALSDYFGSKLSEILDPKEADAKSGAIVTVDHRKFINLYKSELGKSIVNALTSYCLNTDPDSADCLSKGHCRYSADSRKKNLESLKGASFTDDSDASVRWSKCIFGVPDVCYKDAAKDSESKNQACLVMDFVKSARKNIIAADEQNKFYDDLSNKAPILSDAKFKIIADDKAKDDTLTQITSSDLEKEYTRADGTKGKIKDVNDALAQEASECVDDSNQIKDIEKCKKFLNTNKAENERALAEFGVRQEIQAENLEEKLKDQANVASYLKEEGYSEDQIKAMTDNKTLEDTKREIMQRFQAEKAAIIASMQDKIKEKTSSTEGNVAHDGNKLSAIKKKFADKTEELGSLIKFTNIVSAYLGVEEETSKAKSRNTASLFAEVESMKADEARAYKDQIKKANLSENKNDNVTFKIEDINKVLKYDTQPKDKEEP